MGEACKALLLPFALMEVNLFVVYHPRLPPFSILSQVRTAS